MAGLMAVGLAADLAPSSVLLVAGLGLLTWTLGEYLIHRFWLHRLPGLGRGLEFVKHHTLHHKNPTEHPGSIFLWLTASSSVCLWLLLAAALGVARASAFMAGLLAGYLAYEFIHLASHSASPPLTPWGRYLRAHHLAHHTRSARSNYSVVFPLWDVVFRTRFADPGMPRTR
jgi:sterol desaturase/sphingolipid hydroxylase (fatty acid hydroxylase superfamily)